ncbi:MAG TPA: class I SAM-dependent methyltransferase [Acidimicrobiales bacterium]|nr:class I SAM-dependent methyltransferase [Acidimicrobiales bacterium]
MSVPRWYFPEFDPVGTDLASAEAVTAFDRNQGTNPDGDAELLRRLGAAPEMVLVDVGCGTGSLVVEAARRGMATHGVDVSENMLDFTRGRAEQAGVNVCLHRSGFLSYEHHGAPADVVTVRSALHQLPDFWKQVALLRVREFIRPGGVLYVSDVVWCFPPKEWERAIPEWIERMGKPEGSGFTTGDFETHVREEFSTFDWVLEGMLANAHFAVEAVVKPLPWYAAYTCSATPR